jgi:hypothetical protein
MEHRNMDSIMAMVREEMDAYFKERRLSDQEQQALLFDQVRFARSIAWLCDLNLQNKKILDLGAPSLATRVVKRFYPNNSFTNTDFDLRTTFIP